jgi:SNF2 family DNA or RNA helicase
MPLRARIDKYIRKNCGSEVFKRGLQLFAGSAVVELRYDSELDEGVAVVAGSKMYNVSTHFLLDDSSEIESYCSCPYDWDRVCKHQVAALYAYDDYFKNGNRHSGVEQTVRGSLQLTEQLFKDFHKSAEINGMKVDLASVNEFNMDFTVEHSEYFRNIEKTLVKISKNDAVWEMEKCCKRSQFSVCNHQQAVIHFIKKYFKGYNLFENLNDLNQRKLAAKIEYHVDEKVDFNSFFRLIIDENLDFRYIPIDGSFFSKSDAQNMIKSFQEINKIHTKVVIPFSHNQSNGFGYGIVFYFDSSSRKLFEFKINIIEGKLSKDGKKLINSIDYYRGNSYIPDELRLFLNDFDYLKGMFGFTEHPESKYNQISAFLARNTELFASQLCYENNSSYSISRSSLKAIKVNKSPLEIRFQLQKHNEKFQLVSFFKYAENWIAFSNKNRILNGHFFVHDDVLFVIPNYVVFNAAAMLIENSKVILHKDEKHEMVQIIQELSKFHEVDLNDCFKISEVVLARPTFEIYLYEQDGFLILKPEVMYESSERFTLLTSENGFNFDEYENTAQSFVRNLDAENDFKQLLQSFDSSFDLDTNFTYFFKSFDEVQSKNWLTRFFAFCKVNEIQVFGLKNLKSLKYSPYAATVNIGISSNIDWFEPHIDIRFGDEVIPFKKWVDALEKKENFVNLSDGTKGILPDKWVKKLEAILRVGYVENQSLRIQKLKFNLIDELFEEINDFQLINELAEKKSLLKNFNKVEKVAIPKSIKATLRDYQKEGFYWLNFLDNFGFGGCLADDMGLGKTIQLIAFLARQKELKNGTSLVVVPKSLLYNWSAELDKFCPSLTYLHYHGSDRRLNQLDFENVDLVITTYNTVALDLVALKAFNFNYIVLDESQAIKNPTSKRYKSVCMLQARNRLVVTGTPIENNTFDLYAQFNFLNPGFFGSQKDFKDKYANEIDGKNDIARAEELKKMIHPFLLRRTKKQVANDLPEKTEQILTVEMDSEQRKVYNHYLKEIRSQILGVIAKDGLENSKMYILQGMMKLRQICNSPELIKDSEFDCKESAKIDLLMEKLIPLVKTNKVLVFSQFTSMLALIQDRLDSEQIQFSYLDGKTNKRLELVNEFNESESNRVFLISLKAGGTGLNLTSADYVFLVDPWWNPAAEAQAIDRTHRIGQINHVFAYKLICENSIEEKIIKLQEKKKMLSDDLIQAQENFVKKLNQSDVEILFS